MTEATLPELLQIDWRSLRAELSGHMVDATGVVHVRVPDPQAAETIFIRTVTEIWIGEHWAEDQVVVVHVDPADPATHLVGGLASQIAKACGMSSPKVSNGAPLVEIIKDLNAEGGVEIKDNDIQVVINQYEGFSTGDPLDVLRAGLADFLADRRLLIVFRNVEQLNERTRTNLCRELWKNCLAAYAHSGVLMLFLYASDCGLDIPDGTGFPPPATTVVDLPTKIGVGDQPHAIEDVAGIALSEGWFMSDAEALAFADGLVVGAESMRWLHTRLHVYGALRNQEAGEGGSND